MRRLAVVMSLLCLATAAEAQIEIVSPTMYVTGEKGDSDRQIAQGYFPLFGIPTGTQTYQVEFVIPAVQLAAIPQVQLLPTGFMFPFGLDPESRPYFNLKDIKVVKCRNLDPLRFTVEFTAELSKETSLGSLAYIIYVATLKGGAQAPEPDPNTGCPKS